MGATTQVASGTKTTIVTGLTLHQQTVVMMSDLITSFQQVSEVTSVTYVQRYLICNYMAAMLKAESKLHDIK